MVVRGICIRLIAPSCMRAPPDAVKITRAASCSTASRAAATMPSPTAAPIEPPMNSNAIAAATTFWPPTLAMGDDDGVLEPGLLPRLAQAVGVALLVAEAQRVGGAPGQLDAGELAAVEGPFQALGRGGAHVVAAVAGRP